MDIIKPNKIIAYCVETVHQALFMSAYARENYQHQSLILVPKSHTNLTYIISKLWDNLPNKILATEDFTTSKFLYRCDQIVISNICSLDIKKIKKKKDFKVIYIAHGYGDLIYPIIEIIPRLKIRYKIMGIIKKLYGKKSVLNYDLFVNPIEGTLIRNNKYSVIKFNSLLSSLRALEDLIIDLNLQNESIKKMKNALVCLDSLTFDLEDNLKYLKSIYEKIQFPYKYKFFIKLRINQMYNEKFNFRDLQSQIQTIFGESSIILKSEEFDLAEVFLLKYKFDLVIHSSKFLELFLIQLSKSRKIDRIFIDADQLLSSKNNLVSQRWKIERKYYKVICANIEELNYEEGVIA